MTIEYKDSKRIVALSTDVVETLDYSDDFSSDGYTDVGSNVGVSSGKMKFTNTAGGDNRSHKSLGITLDSNFISRFEYKRLSTTSGNIPTYPVVFTATNSDPEADNDFIAIRVDSGGTAYLTVDDGTTNTVTSGITISNDVNYFIELKREGTTSYLSIKTGSHTGSDISGSPVNLSTPATVTGLTTVQHAVKSNQTGGSYNAEIDNLEIYNGETSLTSKPTNVQDNSLLVEKDTARRYWFTASSDFDFSASSSGAVSNQPTDATEVGQLITSTTHRGKKAKSATFYVKRVGSPSGTMVYKIRKSSDNSVVATSTGTSASALSTSTTAVTLNFNDEVIPSENIRVTVSGVTGSSGNLVTVMGGGADTVADQRLSVWGGSSWTEYDNDCAGKLTFTESWTMQPTKEDNFSSWVTSNSAKFLYNSTNNNIDILNSNAYDNIYYDLGSVSDTKWLCKFKVTLTTAGSQSLGFAYFYVGSTTGDANESNDGLGFYFYDNANNTYALADNGNRPDQTTVTGALGISPSTTTYYAEMKRTSATSFTVTLYSDSSYSTSLGTATLTVSSGITGLQYFKIMGYNTTGGLVGTLDDFKFYNGVTSVN